MPNKTLVAVVDEEPSWLGLVGNTLSEHGFHALLLGDGDGAVERITTDGPAVVILPSATLAQRLWSTLGEACPALLLVTHDLEELTDAEAGLFEAAYEKPVSLARIVDEVRRTIGARSRAAI
jgi:DNA-binding response OmpR family regulator